MKQTPDFFYDIILPNGDRLFENIDKDRLHDLNDPLKVRSYIKRPVKVHREWTKGNFYLKIFEKLELGDHFIDYIKRGIYESMSDKTVSKIKTRYRLVKRYSWAIPNEEAINKIREYFPIFELGAGSGYWARMITNSWNDPNYLAYDLYTTQSFDSIFYDVKTVYDDSVKDKTLFLCWPFQEAGISEILKYKFKTIIHVGEYRQSAGCSELYDLIEKEYKETDEIVIPCYDCMNDSLTIYTRV